MKLWKATILTRRVMNKKKIKLSSFKKVIVMTITMAISKNSLVKVGKEIMMKMMT